MLPSHQENFGIVVPEALACGKPVLISNKVNIWREVEEGDGGIVGDDDLEGTKGLIEQWLEMSVDEREEMGNAAAKVYQNCFRSSAAAERMNRTLFSQSEVAEEADLLVTNQV